MNDVIKYGLEPNPDYEQALETQKAMLLGHLAIGSASALELLAITPRSSALMDNFAVQCALDELEASQQVHKYYDGSFSSHNNTVAMYKLAQQ